MKANWEKSGYTAPRQAPIKLLLPTFDVSQALAELEAHPELWDAHKLRTEQYGTPHKDISDIWLRYNDWKHFQGDAHAFTQLPHESVWYDAVNHLPSVKKIVMDVFRAVVGEMLGGVLITRIPPGGKVLPHIDTGWHAEYYEKYAVQLKGNEHQVFGFEDGELRPFAGQLYTFDNSRLHWVHNDSDEDRMTLIICIRR